MRRKWFWVLVNFPWKLKEKPDWPVWLETKQNCAKGLQEWLIAHSQTGCLVGDKWGRGNLCARETKTSDRPADKTTPHLKGDFVILSFKNRHAAVRTGQKHTFRLNHLYRCDSAQNGFDNISWPQKTETKTTLHSHHHYQCQVHDVDVSEATKHAGQKAQTNCVKKTFHSLGKSPGDARSSVMKCRVSWSSKKPGRQLQFWLRHIKTTF